MTMIPVLSQNEVQTYVNQVLSGSQAEVAQEKDDQTRQIVANIIHDVSQKGDEALYALAQQFNDALKEGEPIAISPSEWQDACSRVSDESKACLDEAIANIQRFAHAMMQTLPQGPQLYEHQGFRTGFVLRPVEKVACYVPTGRYPLVSTAMMTSITAQVAGVKERIMLCANPADEILYVAQQAGIQAVYKVGGSQALAAVAVGTAQVPKMDMVVGPGNRFVNEAKRQLNGRIGIDMLAGPSEALLIIDDTVDLAFVASDLLGQSEHDPDARITLLTHHPQVVEALQAELEAMNHLLDLPPFVKDSSLKNSVILVTESLEESIRIANQLAPEHLHLHGEAVIRRQDELTHYGTLFVGTYATIAHGDYCAGPNHTLPTSGAARFSSALSPFTFLRVQNILEVSQANGYLNELTAHLANMEHLTAHAYSALLRDDT
jgi:histidinol dehydrogenase